MPARLPSVAPLGRALLACALLACTPMAAVLVAIAPAQARVVATEASTCAGTTLTEPTRLSDALATGTSAAALRVENGLSAAEFAHLAEDSSTWVDECGDVFVVDRAAPPSQLEATGPLTEQGPPADIFDLSSRPSSDRTIYLDFDGATYSGTRWQNGAEIVSPAYSVDTDRTTFTEVERAQIFLAWQVVAEDFAPFDVNVTTRVPATSALTRTSVADLTYGMPVVITSTNSVGTGCSCGGVAYLDVFDVVGTTEYAPAWIFTNGSGVNGYNVGQVASHEIGHTFGLSHDGTSQSSYYSGAKGWAPIMGSSYNRRASQWSSGEYPDASNTQDDVAIIAATAPTLADDHADGVVGATAIGSGTTTGTITSRSDSDAFTFTASGDTTLAVAGPAVFGDLDVEVTVIDALGSTVATLNPTADSVTEESLAATWTATLPLATAATYTAVVDGTGFGSPAEAGRYSDFGSLGTYAVSLTTQSPTVPIPPPTTTPTSTPTSTPPTTTSATATTSTSAPSSGTTREIEPMSFVTTSLPKARAGTRYRAVIAFTGPVSEARVSFRLPRGLDWRVKGDTIVIRGKVAKPVVSRFAVVLSGDGPTVRHKFRLVVR